MNEKQPVPKNDSLYRCKSRGSGFTFQVNPLVLRIVLCKEAEILDRRSDLALLAHPSRVA